MSAIRRERADISRERRAFLAAAVGLAGMSHTAVATLRAAQAPVSPVPTSRDYSKLEPIPYPDPDVVALDRRFQRYIVFNAPIRRLHIGTSWAEGPAWNGVGRYLVWSDIPANVQMRWIDDDARVTTFRNPANYSNGNTFDKKLYVADTGMGHVKVWDVDGSSLRAGKEFATLTVPGTKNPAAADGMRCDVDGNIWCGAAPGVQVLSPAGEAIGMIRLPEVCANVCFGGARRNRLFMTASQSLYAVYVETTGAHIA